ncbi:transcription factor bHLH57 [Neltuma alba]|uniref:transcription factor bHLH57 n=1 Tax=Neltuma alba TaxID=207710 RepID=UPI0010A46FBE|nr:transcription factor bHLH57-like [Prosopis alba]
MERIQGPINSCFFGEHLGVNYFEQGLIENEDEEELLISLSNLEDRMPFLEMLQSVESQTPQLFPFKDSTFQFQTLVNQKKPCEEERKKTCVSRTIETQIYAPPELESCVTHDTVEMPSRSPAKSENCRRKRKRTRPIKSKEEVENQRMTHIAVERNRRRQMNDHLGVLKSLMPPSYVQKGDQASIIGGAIDFVKELEQLLQSLEAQKRMRWTDEIGFGYGTTSSCGEESNFGEEVKAENKSEFAEIQVTVIQNHVNLKVQCKRRTGQLVKTIVGLEDLRLTILHLNVTSSQASVLYCFNLKVEEECKVVTASEIAGAVEEMLRAINGS